ncbi:MAG: Niacin transporter NiaP [uncultured Truepera sp.]|uniref:Niacin transporter NiaP n=1 Tax=uncultured Truepera sp. TaxID=543023 RepID=A0A6J4V3F0_9DEIN|nr:MAG: Niacin transporter NiaP [uncultured Truepera sp.]
MSQGRRVESVDDAVEAIGLGRFQWRLLGVNGLVWAGDAMEVIGIGFIIPSVIATFGVSGAQAGLVGSLFFAGMLFGAWGFGALGDRVGRRTVFLVTIALNAVFALASAVAPSFGLLLVFRFVNGLAVGGTLPVDYAIMAEYLPKRERGRFLVYLESFWALGTVAVALVAWALVPGLPETGWRWILAVNALPGLLGFWVRLSVLESPRFLLVRGDAAGAKRVLARVAEINGVRLELGDLKAPPAAPRRNTTTALFAPALAPRTLLLAVIWLGLSFGYYGVFTWLRPIFVGQGVAVLGTYWFLILLALAQLPGYALAAYSLERLGRRPTLALFLFASAAASMVFAVSREPAVVVGASLLLSFSLLGAWGALYATTPEAYPTEVRATGMGVMGAVARAGGIVAAQLGGVLLTLSFPLALGLYALSLGVAGGAALLMREDLRGQALSDRVTDAALGRSE